MEIVFKTSKHKHKLVPPSLDQDFVLEKNCAVFWYELPTSKDLLKILLVKDFHPVYLTGQMSLLTASRS